MCCASTFAHRAINQYKPLLEYGLDNNADNLRQWRVGSSNVKLLQIISFFEVSFGRVVGKVYFCGVLNV